MFVTAVPGELEAAATALAAVGAQVAAGNAAAASVHAAVLPPAMDEVSALLVMAHQANHAKYQSTQGVGSAVHAQTVATTAASGVSYDLTEAAGALTML